jgi:hypothetical protein
VIRPPEYYIGEAHILRLRSFEKQGSEAPELSYGLRGRLYASKSGWVLLSVPNALGRGCFDALNEPGVELPPDYNAHISVIRPDELAAKGLDAAQITERGHDFGYTLGPVRTTEPAGWGDMSRVWFIDVNSPDLEKLRKSYGLPPLPNENKFKFHITFAVRRKNVILNRPNAIKHFSVIHNPGVLVGQKKAAGDLDQMQQAKQESDRRNYQQKYHILRSLIAKSPHEWELTESSGPHVGLIHQPTQFKFHMPREAVPEGLDKLSGSATFNAPEGFGPAYSSSRYINAISQTPIHIDPQQGLLGNLFNHIGQIKQRGDRGISEAYSQDRFRTAMAPDHGLLRMMGQLSGEEPPVVSHPLDKLLSGQYF